MLENTNCNFYAKDYEGNGWESLEPPPMVKRYLQAYFRRVPTLQNIAARVVGELVYSERNLDLLEPSPVLRDLVMKYLVCYEE